MAQFNEPKFNAPIPGESLTAELGARPWQKPSQYTTIDEVIEYYLSRMSSDEFIEQLSEIIEMGIPLTTIANTIQMGGVMEGKHSLDTGLLVMPVLIEMMMLVADSAKIKYVSGLEDPSKIKTRPSLIANLTEKLKKQSENKKVESKKDQLDIKEKESNFKGLMDRRDK